MNKRWLLIGKCILCLLLVGILFYGVEAKNQNYDMVFLGDSLFGNEQNESSVPAVVGSELGLSVFNGGLGGTTACCLEESTPENVIENSASFYYLAKVISERNFAPVVSAQPVREDGDLWYFENTVRNLSRIDFSDTQILVIEYGLNDYFLQRPIGEIENGNEYTYIGAIKKGMELLSKTYPNMEILWVIVPYYEENAPEISIAEYVKAQLQVTEELGVLCYNAFEEMEMTAENVSAMTIDGVHLSEEGRRCLGEGIAEFMQENGL